MGTQYTGPEGVGGTMTLVKLGDPDEDEPYPDQVDTGPRPRQDDKAALEYLYSLIDVLITSDYDVKFITHLYETWKGNWTSGQCNYFDKICERNGIC